MTEDTPGSAPAAAAEDPRGEIESLRDQMARRNAELAATLARLAEAQRAAKLVHWTVKRGENVTTWLGSPRDALGVAIDEGGPLPDPDYQRHLHPEDRAQAITLYERLHADGAPYTSEYRIVRDDGSVAWMRETGRRDPDDGDLIVGTIQDITDVMAARHKLRDQESLLQAILDTVPAAVSVRDRAGRYTFANQMEGDWLGVAPAEALGRTLEELVGPEFRVWAESDVKVLATGEASSGALLTETRSKGGPKTWLVSKTPLRDAAGAIDRVATASVDITELRKLEQHLRQAQKMQAVGQLTGGIAHDFNNMLGVIIGSLELARDEPDRERRSELLEAAFTAGNRAAALTKQLLAFARRQVLSPEVVDVNVLVKGMDDMLRRTLGEHIEIRLALAPDLSQAQVDPSQLESSLLNLSINARDAMAKGGVLTIETRNTTFDEVAAQIAGELEPGEYVTVEVSDSGAGIQPDILDKVMEPFFTTKGVGRGTGLGLSMVYGFAKQSGGHLKIYSEVGRGTSVRLFLPAAPAKPQAAPLKDAAESPRADPGTTILLVEDEESIRKLTERVLKNLGYHVVTVGDGTAAAAAIGAHPEIDLLLTDVVLPGGISGFDLAETARAAIPDVKVLFMSGYAEPAVRRQGIIPAGAGLIQKPFRRADLAKMVQKVLQEEKP